MVRIKRGNVARKRRKRVLKLAKGYKGAHSRLFRVSNQQVLKAKRYSYVSRKLLKRVKRQNWISRINSQVRRHGTNYSQACSSLKKNKIALNRKMLSQLILNDPLMFDYVILESK
jgi:large subunit ribosomal protein L20|tara:strand:- start:718 stop:1062 length:345 start_codon:yes stop_codon:yes gene_type:complete